MALPKPSDLWRIIKDVDLEAIRRDACRRLDLLLISEDGDDARAFAAWMTGVDRHGGDIPTHPWLVALSAADGLPALARAPAAAVLVSRHVVIPPVMAALRDHLVAHEVRVMTVIVGRASKAASVTRDGEWARAVVSSLDAEAWTPVGESLLTVTPRELHMSMARQFPPLRSAVSLELIDESAKANASYALTTGLAESIPILTAPLAVGDMVILTKNQLLMCYRIVLAHGRDGDPKALIGEIAGVLGGGVLFRQAARQLVGLIPVLGIVPKVAMAYAGTWAVGRAMMAWAAEGRQVTVTSVRRYAREGLNRGRDVARGLIERSRAHADRASSRLQRLRARVPTLRRKE